MPPEPIMATVSASSIARYFAAMPGGGADAHMLQIAVVHDRQGFAIGRAE